MRNHLRLSGVVLAMVLGVGEVTAAVSVPRGFHSWQTELDLAGWFGGFDYLPDGRLIASDSEEVFILGEERTVVARFENQGLFGSFVKVAPDGQAVYVGESSVGTISVVDLNAAGIQLIGPGTDSVLAEVALNYDMEFDPQGRAFVSAATPGTWQPNRLLFLDAKSGETDLIAIVPGNSGPLAFDGAGSLFYCTSTSYPPEPVESVIFFGRDRIESAIGESDLTDADAEGYISGIYGFSDMVFDGDGDLFGVTSLGDIVEIRKEGQTAISRTFASVSPNGATVVRFLPGTRRFEPFYQGGGSLTFLESDFWSLFKLIHVTTFPEFQVVSVEREQQGMRIAFATEEGKKYQVYSCEDLIGAGEWQGLGLVISGDGTPASVLDAGDEQTTMPPLDLPFVRKRFYRVGVAE